MAGHCSRQPGVRHPDGPSPFAAWGRCRTFRSLRTVPARTRRAYQASGDGCRSCPIFAASSSPARNPACPPSLADAERKFDPSVVAAYL
jgi:hypothetical protein